MSKFNKDDFQQIIDIMNEDNKYYTPTYNDLVNGLEYEELQTVYFNYNEEYQESDYTKYPLIEVDSKSERFTGGKYKIEFWDNRTVDIECGLIPDLEEKRVRVKHLDKEDIEDLRWLDKGDADLVTDYYWDKTGKHSLIHAQKTNHAIITMRNEKRQEDYTAFEGIIKNKSRLKLVMEMVGIIQRGANL